MVTSTPTSAPCSPLSNPWVMISAAGDTEYRTPVCSGSSISTGYLYGSMLRLLSGTDKQDQAIAEALSKMAGAL
jgi:hypothetical protein